jgi:hypothetical protein
MGYLAIAVRVDDRRAAAGRELYSAKTRSFVRQHTET